jgi:Uma2 family endonuclease
MTTTVRSTEQRIVLHNIPWDIYESILLVHRDRSVPRFTYDRGDLEIMSPSAEHEQLKEKMALFVNIVAEEMGINVEGFGSTTFRRQDLDRGFEPDTCFYIENLARVRGKKELDLRLDPPPDLLIEIDITSSSLDKLSIMAEARVPEVWLYDRKGWRILRLQGTEFMEEPESAALPGLTTEAITRLIEDSRTLEPIAWMRAVRQWVRSRT